MGIQRQFGEFLTLLTFVFIVLCGFPFVLFVVCLMIGEMEFAIISGIWSCIIVTCLVMSRIQDKKVN